MAGCRKTAAFELAPSGGGWITLTPLDAQPDPPNLTALKAELNSTWPMTSLLDMVKETDLRLGFTDVLKSPTAYETLDRSVLQPRLLLCLHGIGTNAGLQRMAGLESGVTAKDLAYVRRRYISSVGHAAPSNRDRRRRHAACPQSGNLGQRHDGVRVRFQALRCVGSESDDAVACPLRRPRRHDLLACRAKIALHPLPAQVAVVVGGGIDDRGRDPPLHRDGGRSPVRRFARPEHGRVRLLPAARLSAAAATEGHPLAEAVPAGDRQSGCLRRTCN